MTLFWWIVGWTVWLFRNRLRLAVPAVFLLLAVLVWSTRAIVVAGIVGTILSATFAQCQVATWPRDLGPDIEIVSFIVWIQTVFVWGTVLVSYTGGRFFAVIFLLLSFAVSYRAGHRFAGELAGWKEDLRIQKLQADKVESAYKAKDVDALQEFARSKNPDVNPDVRERAQSLLDQLLRERKADRDRYQERLNFPQP